VEEKRGTLEEYTGLLLQQGHGEGGDRQRAPWAMAPQGGWVHGNR
jgi:hypothetical protein